jgi:hypothetical protein
LRAPRSAFVVDIQRGAAGFTVRCIALKPIRRALHGGRKI